MATVNLSDLSQQFPGVSQPELSAMFSQFERAHSHFCLMFTDTSVDALEHIKQLWNAEKGALIDEKAFLSIMMRVLASFFQDKDGSVKINGKVFGKLEGNLWRACISQELPLLALEMVKDVNFVKQPLAWKEDVLTINAGLARTWIAHAAPRAACPTGAQSTWPAFPPSLVKRYFQEVRPVWDLLWRARDTLFDSNAPKPIQAEYFIVFAHSVASLHRQYYPEYRKQLTELPALLGVALAAWMHVANSTASRVQLEPYQHHIPWITITHFKDCVTMQSESGLSLAQVDVLWRSCIDPIIEGLGVLKFMRTCCTFLSSRPEMFALNLQACLEGLHGIVMFNALYKRDSETFTEEELTLPSRRAFWDTAFLHAIAEALDRQSRTNISLQLPITPIGIASASLFLLSVTVTGIIHRVGNPPVADGRSIYRILSHCLRMLSSALKKPGKQEDHIRAFGQTLNRMGGGENRVIAGLIKTAVGQFEVDIKDWSALARGYVLQTPVQNVAMRRIVQGLAVAAREGWYGDLHALRSMRGELAGNERYEQLLELWATFGAAFGFKETVERDRFDAQIKLMCAWAACEYHSQPCPTPLSSCAGCKEQRYCSRECQKKDWKQGGHRDKCRRLNTSK